MKLLQDSYNPQFNENEVFLTPSQIKQFLYCNRFPYYMNYLGISQYADKNFFVKKGIEVHSNRAKHNIGYCRKKTAGTAKYLNVKLISRKFGLKGEVDEIYELKDGTLAPLDYKYVEYAKIDYDTILIQMKLYSLMIEDMFNTNVSRFYVVYCKDNNLLKEYSFSNADRKNTESIIDQYKKVIAGYYPSGTKYAERCISCCYRNICG